ncbi:expressed protein [Arabidopsis lyrata subsp. lyrata]|uniref:Expressed protein n=1 Tax=Arabidopsis lyrata subsp. lyrata TaxID=81972 RepID=D7L7G7_ARALL|nr:expressed protein [Arabidopsis lyrata subsp. lyrata]
MDQTHNIIILLGHIGDGAAVRFGGEDWWLCGEDRFTQVKETRSQRLSHRYTSQPVEGGCKGELLRTKIFSHGGREGTSYGREAEKGPAMVVTTGKRSLVAKLENCLDGGKPHRQNKTTNLWNLVNMREKQTPEKEEEKASPEKAAAARMDAKRRRKGRRRWKKQTRKSIGICVDLDRLSECRG